MRDGHDRTTVREYVNARLDKDELRANAIWNSNPDLQDAMVVAMKEAKGQR